MAQWFWLWWFFSFFGYLLEKGYAWATHARLQNRKCFILLPLCPVYGASVLMLLLLPSVFRQSWPLLLLCSAVTPCAVEYVFHWYYETFFGVAYWDYRGAPLNLRGRVCLPFALVWTALMPPAVRLIAPALLPLIDAIAPWFTFLAWLLLVGDLLCSRQLLRKYHDTELLRLSVFRRAAE